MTDDRAERGRALDVARSFLVEAPAGSGKTALLIKRFLRLLSHVDRPESIVAMTFTRKAAAEMKERIQKALAEAGGDEPEDPHARETWDLARRALRHGEQRGWKLLEDGGQLQVQTIDSLCAMLTRQMPVTSDFGGASTVVEDASDLYLLAARETVRLLTEGSEEERSLFRRISLHFENNMSRLERQVSEMLSKREQWEFLRASDETSLEADLAALLTLARVSLRNVFRRAATVDFTEISQAARRALGTPENPTDLLYALDYRIEHLLVDEFQDTSLGQYELIKALSEQWSAGDNRTLFLVGDPMQSIYRFRQADVGLFLKCQAEGRLGDVPLDTLRLTSNFRSTPEIVDWVRNTVGPTMTEDNPAKAAVKFRESQSASGSRGPAPEIIPFVDSDPSVEAADVVRLLKRLKPDATVGILVRSRTHIQAILPALRRANIPYRAIDIDQLQEQQHIIDLLALTRAVLHLGDRAAWLGCLRAPWCGLTLADLSALAEQEQKRTIFDLLSDPTKLAALSSDGRERAIRTAEALTNAVNSVGRLPLRDLIENAWMALGGPAALREPNQYEDAQTLFDLLEKTEQGGIIRDFDLLNQRLKLFFARPTTAETRVDVMTVHQAKGLEFDVVIVPQMAGKPRNSEGDLLVWTERVEDDGRFLVLAAQPRSGGEDAGYKQIAEENNDKEKEESKRLLYVACTRAKQELYLLGNVSHRAGAREFTKPGSHTFLGLIWDVVKPAFSGVSRQRVPVQQSLLTIDNVSPASVLKRIPLEWQAPVAAEAIAIPTVLERGVSSLKRVTYEWVSDTSRHAGTVVHRFLERMAIEGESVWTSARIAQAAPIVKSELLRLGVPDTEEPSATKRVLRALRNAAESERGRWILWSGTESRCELAIDGVIDGKLVSGAIDRMFRDEQGRVWIVDFKGGDHRGANVDAFLDEEQRRYSPQLRNYAELVSRNEQGPIWLGLYFPLLDGWREWPFSAQPVAAHYTG